MFKTAMAGMIIFLTNPIIPMRQRLIEKAKLLPEPESYFRGREIGGGFRLPSSLLLYWHDYPHERTIISTRHMLILPAVLLAAAGTGVVLVLRRRKKTQSPPERTAEEKKDDKRS